jgi:carbamoyl-phosphate synthase large subunit
MAMTRVLVTGAGTSAGNNLIRDLRAGDPATFVAGCQADRFVLKKSTADANYLVQRPDHPDFLDTIRRAAEWARVDLVIPTTDAEVRALSERREIGSAQLFLPSPEVVELCQDKYALTCRLHERGVPAPATHLVTTLDEIPRLFELLQPHATLWCRTRTGYGSTAAAPVRTAEQARNWIGYWHEMRAVPISAFTLSEYLPGRDFSCQGLWQDGHLAVLTSCERLSYFVVGGAPSGVSSVSSLAKTVREPVLVKTCDAAVRALGPNVSGAFNLDLKEDTSGVASVTEINAGRFPSGTMLHNLTGNHNLASLYVRLALGEVSDLRGEYDSTEDYYAVRDLDTLPGLFHADELFAGIEDSRRHQEDTPR